MAFASGKKPVIRDDSLDFQGDEVGRGGFGRVYKAWHKDRCEHVAVKKLWSNVSHVMFEEAKFMEKASFKFVLEFIGIYEGSPPLRERGIVTEYMKRGSIETLQKQLGEPPPGPLAFRFVHQTALAMNFLHLKEIVHLDLKPSNILLSDELNVKLADFGLSMESMSVVGKSNDGTTGLWGTYPYIPPEAFEAFQQGKKYKLVRSFDIYSFGILIWSIFTGKEPYPPGRTNDIPDHIPDGQRPGCGNNQYDLLKLKIDGIAELVDLMRLCWHQNPDKRPPFKEILKRHGKDDKSLLLRNSSKVNEAVFSVLKKLDSPNDAQKSLNLHPGAPVSEHISYMEVDQLSAEGDTSKSKPGIDKEAELDDVVDHPSVMELSAVGDSSKSKPRIETGAELYDVDHPVHMEVKKVSVSRDRVTIKTREEKAKFVEDYRDVLIEKVTHVPNIAETLGVGKGKGKMVHPETYNRILKKETDEDKVREIYRILNAGVKVRAAFYDALMIHEFDVMEELGQTTD